MEKSEWYKETTDVIQKLRIEMPYKAVKKVKLERIERIVEHVESNVAIGCVECEQSKKIIKKMLGSIREGNQESIKTYWKDMSNILNHLSSVHQLYTLEDRIAFWVPIGMGIGIGTGIALGAVFGRIHENMTLMAIGLVIGNAFGMSLGVAVAFVQTEVLKSKNQII